LPEAIPGRAAQMSFYFFLSLFPTLLILVAALSRFLDAQSLVREAILARLEAIAPGSIVEVFTSVLDHLADQAGAPVTWGIVVVLWAASSGMVATIRGLNLAYDVAEERPWWKRRLVGLALTLVLMVLVGAAMLLLAYGAGDYNCLHQDLYGEIVFPFQITFFLSQYGRDFAGGEFVLAEQQPRRQSRVEVLSPEQGAAVIFSVHHRPVRGTRGYYRANLRHGVSTVHSGQRYTLGIIFHDAK